jgi:hypothetical protein
MSGTSLETSFRSDGSHTASTAESATASDAANADAFSHGVNEALRGPPVKDATQIAPPKGHTLLGRSDWHDVDMEDKIEGGAGSARSSTEVFDRRETAAEAMQRQYDKAHARKKSKLGRVPGANMLASAALRLNTRKLTKKGVVDHMTDPSNSPTSLTSPSRGNPATAADRILRQKAADERARLYQAAQSGSSTRPT